MVSRALLRTKVFVLLNALFVLLATGRIGNSRVCVAERSRAVGNGSSRYRGQLVDAPPIDLARIQSVGIYMADGKDGECWLEVDYIRAVGEAGE